MITIEYKAGVYTQAGWRDVTVTARADKLSEKRVQVAEVTAIDGEAPKGYTSRSGSKRQRYNASSIAKREIGKVKLVSKCSVV